jgi:hypothetical protein
VAVYGGGGKWFDNNCYNGLPFFVVEFGPPTVDDLWLEQVGSIHVYAYSA